MPVNLSQLLWVARNGIRSIITIRETPLPASWIADSGQQLEYLHLKVEDFCAPSLEQLETTVDYIDQRIEEKKTCHGALRSWKREDWNSPCSIYYETRPRSYLHGRYQKDQNFETRFGAIRRTGGSLIKFRKVP